ncbi:MAG TPA: glycosyltransferase family 2 protein [Nitrospiraceae bacterium]|jgi:glycosyltransferase involved in cell wall biosynthesis|nr:glycosyltransferase family 2 protein [Nitrospiraceae bacterium]
MGWIVLPAMNPSWPCISIITPSFNQAVFLERTILSVLEQGYPNLEYIVIDGGSTDDSVNIIKKYQERLAYWISEPDRGQAHAINKGLRMATGEWVGWQNSDDIFYPGVFESLARETVQSPHADLIIGNMNLIDKEDQVLRDVKYVRPTYWSLLAEGMVLTNQAAFWRRQVHDEIGYLDESLDCSFDYEWFLRLLAGRAAAHVNATWGGLRRHEDTKTSNRQAIFDVEHREILKGREVSTFTKRFFQIRRLLLMFNQGHIKYVSRGLVRRSLHRSM